MSNTISHAEDGAHAGPIKNPRQFITTVLAAFVLPIFIIIGLVVYVVNDYMPAGSDSSSAREMGGVSGVAQERAMALRLQKVGLVEIKSGDQPLRAGEEVFKAQCSACHAAGVAGAPKFGDKGAWAPRITHGYEALLTSALKGKGAMGPQGGGDFQDVEIGRAVVYMANAGGAEFPEPKAAGAAEGAGGAAAPAVQAATPATAASAVLAAAPAQKAETAMAAGNAATAVAAATAAASSMTGAAAATPSTATAAGTPSAATAPAAPTAAAAPAAAAAIAAVSPVPAAAPAGPAVDLAAGEALYKSACFACHAAGVAGAPKFGDKAAWAPRIATGMDTLVKAAIHGKGVMPPRGGSTAADDRIADAVAYMVNAAK